jgi:hypothetical protein
VIFNSIYQCISQTMLGVGTVLCVPDGNDGILWSVGRSDSGVLSILEYLVLTGEPMVSQSVLTLGDDF